jgi:hypothetical protein
VNEFREGCRLTPGYVVTAISVIGKADRENTPGAAFDDPDFPVIAHDRVADHDVHC